MSKKKSGKMRSKAKPGRKGRKKLHLRGRGAVAACGRRQPFEGTDDPEQVQCRACMRPGVGVKEAAEELGVRPRFVRLWAKEALTPAGEGPPSPVVMERPLRLDLDKLRAWRDDLRRRAVVLEEGEVWLRLDAKSGWPTLVSKPCGVCLGCGGNTLAERRIAALPGRKTGWHLRVRLDVVRGRETVLITCCCSAPRIRVDLGVPPRVDQALLRRKAAGERVLEREVASA